MVLNDAVMPGGSFKGAAREQFKHFKKLTSGWFCSYQLPHGVIAIAEPYNFQEVMSFLVAGESSALLIDTGMGIGDIKAEAESLTGLPITVVNTHSHFDHIGGNWQFKTGFIYKSDQSVRRKESGVSTKLIGGEASPDKMAVIPNGFDTSSYHVRPFPGWQTFENEKIFELGSRKLRAVPAAGHAPDCIVLADDANKLLFTGDTFYPAALYAHLANENGAFEQYRQTLHMLSKEFNDYTLICSHNEPIRPGSVLAAAAAALDSVSEGKAEYAADPSGLKRYDFDGFSLITK